MAGNVLIKNANGKTVTLQNPDTNNIDITLDLSNIALDNEKVDIASFVGSNVSLSSSGYQKLPSGLIIQWGGITILGDSNASIPFPIAFPNSCFTVFATFENQAGDIPAPADTRIAQVRLFSKTSVTLRNLSVNASSYVWFAIGY